MRLTSMMAAAIWKEEEEEDQMDYQERILKSTQRPTPLPGFMFCG